MLLWGEPELHNVKKRGKRITTTRTGEKAKTNSLDMSNVSVRREHLLSLAILRAKAKDPNTNKKLLRGNHAD